jgi:hypothetical protein
MTQRHFFATADDLVPVFELVESGLRLAYTPTGLFETSQQPRFISGKALPTLRKPAGASSINCPTYLVTPAGTRVVVRTVPQRAGGVRYAVDQLANADSVALTHGGLFSPEILISGRVATVSKTPGAKEIQAAFSKAIGKLFKRVGAFHVGPEAAQLFDGGCRLTQSAKSPREYDLARA